MIGPRGIRGVLNSTMPSLICNIKSFYTVQKNGYRRSSFFSRACQTLACCGVEVPARSF